MKHLKPLFFAASMLTVLGGTLVATTPAASARDYPYCLQGRSPGYPGECSFTSYAQCQATASGTGSSCGINPRVAFAQQGRSGYDGSNGFGQQRQRYMQ